ncbi:hypothetical protein [Streptomyces acidiscabies]|uniref:hypothetical protein n=1 Tax=Streptomyces acidiscabies TaxID=42234 RepID=UPI0038F6C546
MGGFVEAVRERVRQARIRVRAAERSGDAYEKAVAEDELDDALRIARVHGVDAEQEEEGEEGGAGDGSAV